MKNVKFLIFISLPLLIACNSRTSKVESSDSENQKPNIIMIMVDDMGYSDLGCFGSEIPTPHIDKLAKDGLTMTSFYNASRCCPSRASLLTGLYAHQTGVGAMSTDWNLPGYKGFINKQSATMGEVMQLNGYNTYLSGKWHVGKKKEQWPFNRGFDESFALIDGVSDYFNLSPFWNEEHVTTITLNDSVIQPHDNFYMTTEITNYASEFIKDGAQKDKPFFMYVAYTAPHWPLHALEEDIALFEGKYMDGWDVVREKRYEKMIALGIIDSTSQLSPRHIENDPSLTWQNEENEDVTPDWNSLTVEEKKLFDLRMAVYAAMVYRVDKGIGKIVENLKETNQFDNTLIVFISDNGGCPEPIYLWDLVHDQSGPVGSPESFDSYGYPWANVSNTPFRWFKHWVHEGGISTPLIAHYPKAIKAGSVNREPAHIIDLMTTFVELGGGVYPDSLNGEKIQPMEGLSLTPIFETGTRKGHEAMYWEHEGNRAIRKGDWKLVSRFEYDEFTPWELYNLKNDRSEMNNLVDQKPKKVKELKTDYKTWAKRANVIPWDSLGIILQAKK